VRAQSAANAEPGSSVETLRRTTAVSPDVSSGLYDSLFTRRNPAIPERSLGPFGWHPGR
jgi:hypothetical protein